MQFSLQILIKQIYNNERAKKDGFLKALLSVAFMQFVLFVFFALFIFSNWVVKFLFRTILIALFMVFLISIVGSVILDTFPSLVPLWEEIKAQITELYQMSEVKYGTGVTLLIIVALFIVIGSSNRKV